jgi:hypothetical protein
MIQLFQVIMLAVIAVHHYGETEYLRLVTLGNARTILSRYDFAWLGDWLGQPKRVGCSGVGHRLARQEVLAGQ